MATVEDSEEQTKGSGLVAQIVIVVVLTFLALAAGWGVGQFMRAEDGMADIGAKVPTVGAAMHDKPDGAQTTATPLAQSGSSAHPLYSGVATPLLPIITSLAASEDIWVRLELAVVTDGSLDSSLAEAIHQDLFAYVRTINLRQIDGPSGFLNLKSDLADRASIRSDGKVKGVLIRTLLFE